MTEKIKTSLRDSTTARWIALALISSTMFFAYFFVDVVAPLQTDLERIYKWTPEVFGMLGGSEFFLNVFAFMLIFSGRERILLGRRRAMRERSTEGNLQVD